MKRILPFAILAATAAVAGPYDQPYSIVVTDVARSADPNLRPVIINRIDDETMPSGYPAVVAPGLRKVTVDLPPRRGFHQATQVTFDLDAKPCTRYYISAKLDTPVTQDWKPVVRAEEPIGECKSKFKIG